MVTGWLMNKDMVVAEIKNDNLIPVNSKLMPIYLQRNGSIIEWIRSRSIDGHRTNSRLLKRMLRLRSYDEINSVLRVNAATITDNYWIKTQAEQDLTYADVKYKENIFSELALRGDVGSLEHFDTNYISRTRTPELTNIGSYEKCWKLEGNQWYLYKKGTKEAVFSELLISKLGEALGFDMATYEYVNETTIRTIDFTGFATVNFEPAASLVGENVDYIDNCKALAIFAPHLIGQYLNMLFMDAICFNFDRHTLNYGFITEADTGKVLKLAPNFDNNMALLAVEGSAKLMTSDVLIEDFIDVVKQYPFIMPSITTEELSVIAKTIANTIPLEVDKALAVRMVTGRYEALLSKCHVQSHEELEL